MGTNKVLASVLEKPGRLRLQEFDRPTIGDREALLKLEMAGICSTDVKQYHGSFPCPYPIVMGHEILGHVEEVGREAARAYGVNPGDRVVVEASVPCGSCLYCRTGAYRHCERRLGYGTKTPTTVPPGLWGSYAEHMYLMPGSGLYKVEPQVRSETAALITTVIANGIQWARNVGGIRIGDTVVMVGAGPQALGCAAASRECGAGLTVVMGLGVDEGRLELAKEMGADLTVNVEQEDPVSRISELTRGRMADVVVDVSGSPRGTATAIDLAGRQATVVLGGLAGSDTRTSIPGDSVVLKEIRLLGVFTKGADAISAAVAMAHAGRYPFHKMVTHRFPLAEAERAVRCTGRELEGVNPIKVVLTPS